MGKVSMLTEPSWSNSHVLGSDLVAEATKLREAPGGDCVVILVYAPTAEA